MATSGAFLSKETHILLSQTIYLLSMSMYKLTLELVGPWVSLPFATLITKHIIEHNVKLLKIVLMVRK